jgi:hypothetical protein
VPIYQAWNAASPTTGALGHVTTGSGAVKTMLQLEDATNDLTILAWGYSMDGSALAAGIQWSLLEQDVAATVTAHVIAGIVKWDDPNAVASAVTLGTANTGYTSSGENSPTVSRVFDSQITQPGAAYVYEFSLGERPKLLHGRFLKSRVDVAAAAVNALTFIRWSTD